MRKDEPKIPEAAELIRRKNEEEKRKALKAKLLSQLKRPRVIAAIMAALALFVGFLSMLAQIRDVKAFEESQIAQNTLQVENQYLSATLSKVSRHDCASRGRIPKYTLDDILKMDLTKPSNITVNDLKKITQGGLKGQEKYFVQAEKKYGVNCVFLLSIAVLESGWGNYMYANNNMFGFGGIDFASKKECILSVGKALGKNYLSPKGPYYHGKTISGVHTRYASSGTWTAKIANIMLNLYTQMRANNLKSL